MFVVHGLPHDPTDHDRVIGWVVFRPAPWHLVGVFATEYMARKELQTRGDDYHVQLGSYKLGSQDFKAFTFEL
ncbi:hypothetical protein I5418_18505 [Citrobacter braakii]|uniref:hypothetical protein n=1 Tax=Citrobacter braakii TaxID=57706 RepID=UPI001907813B|nr:hypothetical protein [Citrobacter braakii]MBJ8899089.1 hypothetical protein [Citrobacter braakii]